MLEAIYNNVIHYDRIGIGVSGGLDSAVLLYLLAKYHVGTGQQIHCVTQDIYRDNRIASRASAIIAHINSRLPYNQIKSHTVYYTAMPEIGDIKRNLFAASMIDLYVSGTTANPPPGSQVAGIDINLISPCVERFSGDAKPIRCPDGDICRPLATTNKLQVLTLAHNLGCDDLIDLTQSCAHAITPCGVCWWCLERQWALDEYNNLHS